MVLEVYIDDSKDAKQEKYLVLAGYIAPAHKWAHFSTDWEQNLKDFEMEEFKSSQMPRDNPEYTANFYRLIEKHVEFAVSCHIDISALNQVLEFVPEHFKDSAVGQKIKNPYFIASKYLMVNLYENIGKLISPEPLDFIFDEQEGEDRVLLEAFPYLKYCLPNKNWVGSVPIFRNSKIFLPLQAADLLSGQLKRALDAGKDISSDKIFSWECRKEIKSMHTSLNKNDLEKEIEFLFSDENFRQLMEYDGYTFEDSIDISFILNPVVWQTSS